MERSVTRYDEVVPQEFTQDLVLGVLALAVGAISFGGSPWTISLSISFPILLYRADTRTDSFLIALFYHAAATRSLATAAGNFFGHEIFFGILIWAIGNALNAAVYALLWNPKRKVRLLTIPLAMILMALPPLGILGWASPFTAAGIIFPGSGVLGLAYVLGLYLSIAHDSRKLMKAFALLSLWYLFTAPKLPSSPIAAVSTNFQKIDDGGKGDYERQVDLKQKVSGIKGKILLLPEGIVQGGWTEAGERLWASEKRPVLIGAEDKVGRPQNTLALTRGSKKYLQRQPVPFSMWRPFDNDSFASNWFDSPVIDVNGLKIAPLICYEGFLVWPIVHSNLSGAKFIAATGNYWWAKDTEMLAIHASIINAWSRLFSMPSALAVNL